MGATPIRGARAVPLAAGIGLRLREAALAPGLQSVPYPMDVVRVGVVVFRTGYEAINI